MKKFAWAFAGTMLALGVVAVHLWMERNSERQQLAELQGQISELQKAASSPPPPVPEVVPAVAVTGPEAPASPAPAPAAPALLVKDVVGQPPALTDSSRRRMGDTERRMLRSRYPGLAKDLGLTQAEADTFLDLLARQTEDRLDGMRDTLNMNLEDARRVAKEKEASLEAEQAAMLGDKYPQWQAYGGTITARGQVRDLQSLLASDGNPLSATQIGQLVAAMSPEFTRAEKESRALAESTPATERMNRVAKDVEARVESNRRIDLLVAPYVTAAQLECFKQLQAKKAESDRLAWSASAAEFMARSQAGAGQ